VGGKEKGGRKKGREIRGGGGRERQGVGGRERDKGGGGRERTVHNHGTAAGKKAGKQSKNSYPVFMNDEANQSEWMPPTSM
jgi:hypothetical protein